MCTNLKENLEARPPHLQTEAKGLQDVQDVLGVVLWQGQLELFEGVGPRDSRLGHELPGEQVAAQASAQPLRVEDDEVLVLALEINNLQRKAFAASRTCKTVSIDSIQFNSSFHFTQSNTIFLLSIKFSVFNKLYRKSCCFHLYYS